MASIDVTNITTRSALVTVMGLQYPANQYTNFEFYFYQNGTVVIDVIHTSSSGSTTFYMDFSNESYKGYNWFTPETTYTLVVTAVYNGNTYSVGSDTFTTDSIAAPIGTITPSFYTPIKDQGSYNNCIPMSLSTAMEIFKTKQTGITYERYSSAYIWGNGNGYTWGMYYKDAVVSCVNYGSPRWELVEEDTISKTLSASVIIYNNGDTYARNNAALQKFDGYTNIDFYDTTAVKNAITNYGYFMFNFQIPNNLYSVGSDGIVPQPDSYTGVNHSIALIGLTTKNGKAHWIAQNSWGTSWGASGICYIPYDWGIGVQAPNRSNKQTPASWTSDSYAPYNSGISNANPLVATNIAAVKTGDLTANVTWNSSVPGATFTVLASKKNLNKWYIKGRSTTNSLSVTFDTSSVYEVMVLTSVSNLYSDKSAIAEVALMNIVPWEWFYPKTIGVDFNVTREEWLAFCSKINEIRIARGLSSYGFTTSTTYIASGKPFLASIFRQAATAINQINNQVPTEILNAATGGTIYAWYFDTLKTALNNALT